MSSRSTLEMFVFAFAPIVLRLKRLGPVRGMAVGRPTFIHGLRRGRSRTASATDHPGDGCNPEQRRCGLGDHRLPHHTLRALRNE